MPLKTNDLTFKHQLSRSVTIAFGNYFDNLRLKLVETSTFAEIITQESNEPELDKKIKKKIIETRLQGFSFNAVPFMRCRINLKPAKAFYHSK